MSAPPLLLTPRASCDAILERLRPRGIRLGLDVPQRLLAGLGHPERSLSAVLVGGTNGKGSTAALLASMARAAGIRTGLFTSPALLRPAEPVQVDGAAVEPEALAATLDEVLAVAGERGLEPTGFETLAAAALVELARRRVELAVIEVGMGGGGDATNVVEPLVSVITTVDLDHVDHLGPSLTHVASHKAGILRRDREAVVGWIGEESAAVVLARAREIGARAVSAARTVRRLETRPTDHGQTVTIETATSRHVLDLLLAGRHQARNLAVAVLASEALARCGFPALGRPDALRHGVADCRWPGRMEWIRHPRRRVLLDAAHNASGIEALANYLEQHGETLDLLFGALRDKPAPEMVERLRRRFRRVTLTEPDGGGAWCSRALAEAIGNGCGVEPRLAAALDRTLAEDETVPLVVTGSLRLVGQVRGRLLP